MLNIILDVCIFLLSLILSIYVSISKNIYIIASIEHEKVKPENISKISYIFSICLFLGTSSLITSSLVSDFNHKLAIILFILGILILVLFYVSFLIIEKDSIK